MTEEQLKRINNERLSSWNEILNKQHSTPILMLGIGHDHVSGEVRVLTTEDMSNEQLILFVSKTLELLLDENSSNK